MGAKAPLWLVVAVLGLGALRAAAPGLVERRLNAVSWAGGTSERSRRLHGSLEVADLHADPLLWGRDLLVRGDRGHLDVPRLIEGRYALQVFGIVTRVPMPIRRVNGPTPDSIAWLSLVGGWPRLARATLTGRALYQAARLHRFARASGGRLTVVRSAADLRAYMDRRRTEPAITAGLLAVEGAHALDGDLANLDRLYDAGVRMMAPSHFFDTEVGGSAHGLAQGGLTDLGRRWLARMEERRMIVDLAHASPAAFSQALALASRPVVVSHTGVRGTCDNPRNLSDDQLRGVALGGGLVGIGYWELAVCGSTPAAIAKAFAHAKGVIGAEHLALGSDFDGAVRTPFDATGLDRLIEALLAEGFTEEEVRLVLGANLLAFLERNL